MRPLTQRRLSFSLLTVAGMLLMAEVAAAWLGRRALLAWEAPVPVTHTGAPYLPGNPFLLWEMVPGERTEMGVDVHINTLGFRGRETTAKTHRTQTCGSSGRLHGVRAWGRRPSSLRSTPG